MRILFYNWAPIELKGKGGGVSVYLRNLVNEITTNKNNEVIFLSSGVFCDIKDKRLRYEEISHKNGQYKAYSIINSPIYAPAYLTFCRIEDFLKDCSLRDLFVKFIDENGPFDVIHFNNIEGLSLQTFSLKSTFPDINFVFTIHNYNLFCPQVNLWRQEEYNCNKGDTGEHCLGCMTTHVPAEKLNKKMSLTYELFQKSIYRFEGEYLKRAEEIDDEYAEAEKRALTDGELSRIGYLLHNYKNHIVRIMNENIDNFIAVSERVKEIAINNGIIRDKIKTIYIGTDFASRSVGKYREVCNDNKRLSIIYMGYQRRDKGFYFLIDALNKMDKEYAKTVDLTLAAMGEENNEKSWSLDDRKFHSFTFFNGYNHEMIDEILEGKNLGIVPILWEDNMPQVSMEIVSHGIPILSSNLGGAGELCQRNEKFVFQAGDTDMFLDKLYYFIEHPSQLSSYFDTYIGLKTMKEHVEELYKIYFSGRGNHDSAFLTSQR